MSEFRWTPRVGTEERNAIQHSLVWAEEMVTRGVKSNSLPVDERILRLAEGGRRKEDSQRFNGPNT